LLVDTHGNTVVEPASDLSNNDAVNTEGSANEEVKYTENFHADNELEDVIRNSVINTDQQFSEQAKVVELETKIEKLELDLQSKSTENSVLHIRIKELESEQARLPHNNQEDKSFDVQFQVPFEDLRAHMSSCLSKNYAVSKVSFTAKVDVVNRKLADIQIG
jgi:hypothetical protein